MFLVPLTNDRSIVAYKLIGKWVWNAMSYKVHLFRIYSLMTKMIQDDDGGLVVRQTDFRNSTSAGCVVVSGDYFNSKLHTRKIHSLMKDWSDDYDDVLVVMQVHQ